MTTYPPLPPRDDTFIGAIVIVVGTVLLVGIPLGLILRRMRDDTSITPHVLMLIATITIDILLIDYAVKNQYTLPRPLWRVDQLPYFIIFGLTGAFLLAAYLYNS